MAENKKKKQSIRFCDVLIIPPVQTNGTGLAEISPYTIAGDSITYTVNATNIKDVTAGHVHFGNPGENGPIVFTMFEYDPS